MRLFALLLFFIFLQTTLCAQKIITGNVVDNEQKPISYVNVVLQTQDSIPSIVSYTYANEQGIFELKLEGIGNFDLIVSVLSYEKIIQPITISEQKEQTLNTIILKEKLFELNEVIVEADLPIDIKKDTIIYKVETFLKGNEVVIEDLLKNLPGINVDSEGTIRVGNQEIEKLMVDGDDLFEKGYKILSKSLPVHPIESVELLKKYSNNRLLKGIENSDKVALNLKLKDEAKDVWFGDVSLGYGLELNNIYSIKGNLANFGKKKKYYFLTNLNNSGENATGDINQLIRPFRYGEAASIGDDQRLPVLNSLHAGVLTFNASRTNFNNSELASLNAIFRLSEKVKLKTLGFFNSDENDFFTNSVSNFTGGGLNFTNTEDFILRKVKKTAFGKVDLIYDISKNKIVETNTKFNFSDYGDVSDLLFNGLATRQALGTTNKFFDQEISYSNKFKAGKAFLLSGRYIDESSPQEFTINRFLYQDLFPEVSNANNVAQLSENKYQFIGIEGHLLDRRKNGSLVELKLGNELRRNYLKTTFNINNENILLERPAEFQNNLEYTTNNLYLKSKYIFKINRVDVIGNLNFHQLFNGLQFEETNAKQSPFFINPSLGFNWEVNSKNKINASVGYSTNNAEVLSIPTNYSLRGFRSFSKGTSEFNQLNSSNYSLSYSLGDFGKRIFTDISFNFINNHDFFSTNTIIDPNFSLSEQIIIKDRKFLSVASNLSYYIKPFRTNLKLSSGYFQSNFKNIVNNSDLRSINTASYTYGLKLKSGFKGFFNYHIGTEWQTNNVASTSFANSFTDNTSYLDLTFLFNDRFTLDIQIERYVFGNVQANNVFNFIDVDAKYVVKKNKLTFFLKGRNLFNTNNFTTASISDIGNVTTTYRLLPRFALLQLQYRF